MLVRGGSHQQQESRPLLVVFDDTVALKVELQVFHVLGPVITFFDGRKVANAIMDPLLHLCCRYVISSTIKPSQ